MTSRPFLIRPLVRMSSPGRLFAGISRASATTSGWPAGDADHASEQSAESSKAAEMNVLYAALRGCGVKRDAGH